MAKNECDPDEIVIIESDVKPKIKANSSIGQLISKSDKDIESILSEWEATYDSCDFDLFRGMAENLNKQYVWIMFYLWICNK